MSSQRRIESSRANGAMSRGPNTPEGKFISSQNSLRHGLTAKAYVLTNESPERFEALMQGYIDEIQPTSPIQMDLVEQMTVSKWRQRRLWATEVATFDLITDRQQEDVNRVSNPSMNPPASLSLSNPRAPPAIWRSFIAMKPACAVLGTGL